MNGFVPSSCTCPHVFSANAGPKISAVESWWLWTIYLFVGIDSDDEIMIAHLPFSCSPSKENKCHSQNRHPPEHAWCGYKKLILSDRKSLHWHDASTSKQEKHQSACKIVFINFSVELERRKMSKDMMDTGNCYYLAGSRPWDMGQCDVPLPRHKAVHSAQLESILWTDSARNCCNSQHMMVVPSTLTKLHTEDSGRQMQKWHLRWGKYKNIEGCTLKYLYMNKKV